MLTVNEIFHSIQGESTHAGRPCVFVRLTACDLRCSWCDTPYAFHEGQKMSRRRRGRAASREYGCDVVEITGGEPLLQKDVYPLMQRLLDDGRTVMLETGGHLSVDRCPSAVIRVIDVKCPGSGEAGQEPLGEPRPAPADRRGQVRHQGSRRLRVRARRRRDSTHLIGRCAAVHFSPVHGVLDPSELAEWILADRLPVRLQLQVHKYIWDPSDARGVVSQAVLLLSGGLDSYTAGAIARRTGTSCTR